MKGTITNFPDVMDALSQAYINDDLADLTPGPDLIKQRTPEWFAARRGRFTGSEVWKLTVPAKDATAKKLGEFGDTAMSYIRKVLAEVMTGESVEIDAVSLSWGLKHETAMKALYTKITGNAVTEDAFCPFGEYGGGSVDGLIAADGLLEGKCPYNSGIHLDNLILASKKPNEAWLKSEKRELYWQVQNNMMCTGRKWAHFVSYDPRFPAHQQMCIISVGAVEADQNFLRELIDKAAEKMNEMKEELAAFKVA